ncbi:hypothetical protein MVEN_00686500 [Mycena venus]|uniref:Uncharacterized protein n=1 Tax=Mycena venus TaxID=2733690 RepID=A0A8H6YIB2_9AGAR|nr:hypothetical protein MVEN_00686500 [Mycena venus]
MHFKFHILHVLLAVVTTLASEVVTTPAAAGAVGASANSTDLPNIYLDFGSLLDTDGDPTDKALSPRIALGGCFPLQSKDKLMKLSAVYNYMLKWAKDVGAYLYGDVVSDPTTGEKTLKACTGNTLVKIQPKGPPTCRVVAKASRGKIINATAEVTLGFKTGTSRTTSMSVTRSVTDSVGVSASVGFEVGVVSGSASTEFSVAMTDEVGTSVQDTVSDETEDTIKLIVPRNHTCHLTFNVTTCTTPVSAEIPLTLSGYFWFSKSFYPGPEKFYLDYFKSRSGWDTVKKIPTIELDGTSSVRSSSDWDGVCTPVQ